MSPEGRVLTNLETLSNDKLLPNLKIHIDLLAIAPVKPSCDNNDASKHDGYPKASGDAKLRGGDDEI